MGGLHEIEKTAMGIHFTCPNGHRLHVKSFLAGKRGICPHCASRFDIPLADTGRVDAADPGSEKLAMAEPLEPALAVAGTSGQPGSQVVSAGQPAASGASRAADAFPQAQGVQAADWYVRLSSGDQYGPADEALLRQWIRESRVDADSLVWREDWSEWRRAADVFAELAPSQAPTHPVFVDIPDPSQISGKGPLSPAISPTDRGGTAARRGHAARTTRPGKGGGTKRLVAVLSLVVAVLAAALVLIVVYFGQN